MNSRFRKVAFLYRQDLKVAFLNRGYVKVAFLNLGGRRDGSEREWSAGLRCSRA